MAQSAVSTPSKVGNNYYVTKVVDNGDGTFGSTLFRTDAKGEGGVPIAGYGAAGTTTAQEINTQNATPEEQKLLSDSNSQLNQVRRQQVQSTEKDFFGTDGGTAEQKAALNKSAGKANTATNPEGGNNQGGLSPEQQAEFEKEQGTFKEGTRLSYSLDMRYPLDLALEHQDCIKFSILKYRPSAADASKTGTSSNNINRIVSVESGIPGIKGSERIGTITFPIPAGISDSNSADWQQDTITELQDIGMNIAKKFITGGAQAGATATGEAVERGGELIKGDAQQGLSAMFAGLAVGSSKAQQRLYGSTFNNNLELLFNGPTLRSAFTFNFKLSPKDEKEAREIRKIIRAFKQSMAVKRSATSLLLKSPHTYAISYLTSNQDHPYLNKFKECALISCSVDYTPEGTYMTYMSSGPDGRSMVSYNLSLTFQELEPIFDDEYAVLDNNTDKFIGF